VLRRWRNALAGTEEGEENESLEEIVRRRS
jgi:hypothetical protein